MSKQKTPHKVPPVPWRYSWSVAQLGHGKTRLTVSPDKNVRSELATFLNLVSLPSLVCDLEMHRRKGCHTLHIHGCIRADIEQICVHSLTPIQTHIEEEFDSYFADRADAVPFSHAKKELFSKYGMDDTPILEEAEDPEPIENRHIDFGALIVEFLSLSIDPYPHIEGADCSSQTPSSSPPLERKNPFEALKDWKKNK